MIMFRAQFRVAIVTCVLIVAKPAWVETQQTCQTSPTNTTGVCIPINECPRVFAAISNLARPGGVTKYLRTLQCGQQGRLPKVCCENESPCANPETLFGSCVNIYLCPQVLSLLPVRSPQYLLSLQCDKQRDPLRVCCSNPDQPLPKPIAQEPFDAQLPTKCGTSGSSNRIVGGTSVEHGEFPWMAMLIYDRSNTPKCGGSLINSRYVLTAAHCIIENLHTVRLGEHDVRTDPDCVKYGEGPSAYEDCTDSAQNIRINQSVIHPQYNSKTHTNDIALIRLSERVTITDFISPACLPKQGETESIGTNYTVAGWGSTESNFRSSEVILKLELPYVSFESCTDSYKPYNILLSTNQICAGGERGKDSCTGDSGGPLMVFNKTNFTWTIKGVVSFGTTPCGVTNPGVYTKVEVYLDWIMSTMHNLEVISSEIPILPPRIMQEQLITNAPSSTTTTLPWNRR